jgi:hypothetical protein
MTVLAPEKLVRAPLGGRSGPLVTATAGQKLPDTVPALLDHTTVQAQGFVA